MGVRRGINKEEEASRKKPRDNKKKEAEAQAAAKVSARVSTVPLWPALTEQLNLALSMSMNGANRQR